LQAETIHYREYKGLFRLPALARRVHLQGVVIDSLTNSLEHYMDLVSTRQKLVASNIANADTPGYKTQDIDFQNLSSPYSMEEKFSKPR